MKKLGFFLIVFVLLGSYCFAQSNNDAQRIVGTWRGIDTDGDNWNLTLNSNGTYTSNVNNFSVNGNYFISGLKFIQRGQNSNGISMADYYLSSDGRRLVLVYSNYSVWLDKQ